MTAARAMMPASQMNTLNRLMLWMNDSLEKCTSTNPCVLPSVSFMVRNTLNRFSLLTTVSRSSEAREALIPVTNARSGSRTATDTTVLPFRSSRVCLSAAPASSSRVCMPMARLSESSLTVKSILSIMTCSAVVFVRAGMANTMKSTRASPMLRNDATSLKRMEWKFIGVPGYADQHSSLLKRYQDCTLILTVWQQPTPLFSPAYSCILTPHPGRSPYGRALLINKQTGL